MTRIQADDAKNNDPGRGFGREKLQEQSRGEWRMQDLVLEFMKDPSRGVKSSWAGMGFGVGEILRLLAVMAGDEENVSVNAIDGGLFMG